MSDPERPDAYRNRELLLKAARRVFTEDGADASLREVARVAKVGIGTLYRHFPSRDALLQTLLGADFDRLQRRAAAAPASTGRYEALLSWLTELAAVAMTYRGLPELLLAALRNDGSQLFASCTAMRQAGGLLLRRAQDQGLVRGDITADDLFALAVGAAWAGEHSTQGRRLARQLLSIAAEGLAAPGR